MANHEVHSVDCRCPDCRETKRDYRFEKKKKREPTIFMKTCKKCKTIQKGGTTCSICKCPID